MLLHLRFLPALFLAVALLASRSGGAQTAFAPDERAQYGVICRASGRALDVERANTKTGTPLVQWEFTHAPSQQWQLVSIRAGGEYYRLQVKHSGQCLTLERAGENVPLVQRPFNGATNQQWRLVPAGPAGSFQLENRAEGLVAGLSAADKFNGTTVVAQRASGRASQQWRLFKLRLNLDTKGPAFGPPQPLGAQINSAGNELQPVISPDNRALYFARTRFAGNTEGAAESGDAWVSRSPDQGLTWGPPTRLDAFNTPQNNGVLAVVGGGGKAGGPARLLLRGTYEAGAFRDEGCSLAEIPTPPDGAKATRPQPVRIANYYAATVATGFFMSADQQVLLLSLERGDSEGLNDLYVSRREGSGGYSEPRSLGAVVNSPGFEFAPWLAPGGKTLYFSSMGHQGYGSADVFVSERLDDSWSRWSEPRNLGAPVNGPGFDAYFSITADGQQAYYAASPTPGAPANLFRTARVERARPDSTLVANEAGPRVLFTGRVLDAATRQPVAGAEVKATLLAGQVDFRASGRVEGNTGGFQLSLLLGRYRVEASGGGGFLSTVDTVRFASGSVGRDLLLRPAVVGARLELPTIIFAQSKATLLAASYAELNRLSSTLALSPKIEIRLEGHTDNVGPADKNQQLSEDRVAEVKRYLVSRGVSENRITTIGFGGTKPRFKNDREETRKLNRRVELVITK
ncbi:RICIN domain-containing protein [uncultured Hymenobacter sp.]|uniref:RICIN domain-containing protein n=1 Tax=uncultured Hymenobacter sp. TaxID=170016 RepID=UPI0035CB0836